MRRRQYLAAASTAAALGLAGCGGGSGGGNNTTGGGTEAGGPETEASTETEAATAIETEPGAAATAETEVGTETTASDADTTTTAGGETTTETTTATETEAATTGTETTTTAGEETTTVATETTSGTTTGSQSSGGGFSETFSGSGTSTVEGLELSTGPILAEYSHSGSANFIVTLVTLEGESFQDVSLTNLIGEVEGSQAALVNASGGHNLNVDADGDWEVALEQPTNPQPESLPIDASGSGPMYIGPFEFGGPTTFQGSHSGESNFIVETVPLDSSGIGSIVFNEIGQFEGETTGRVSGSAYVNVAADGEWTLSTG